MTLKLRECLFTDLQIHVFYGRHDFVSLWKHKEHCCLIRPHMVTNPEQKSLKKAHESTSKRPESL